MMDDLQRIPETGDAVEMSDFRFTVEEIKGRRVERVRIDGPTEGRAAAEQDKPNGDSAKSVNPGNEDN